MATTQGNVVLRHLRALAAAERASQLSDRQLLECFLRQRDDATFETLIRRHGSMVLSVCGRILGNRDGIEDAFQAALLVLVSKARSIVNRESVGGWLHQVAANTTLKARGRASNSRAVSSSSGSVGDQASARFSYRWAGCGQHENDGHLRHAEVRVGARHRRTEPDRVGTRAAYRISWNTARLLM